MASGATFSSTSATTSFRLLLVLEPLEGCLAEPSPFAVAFVKGMLSETSLLLRRLDVEDVVDLLALFLPLPPVFFVPGPWRAWVTARGVGSDSPRPR